MAIGSEVDVWAVPAAIVESILFELQSSSAAVLPSTINVPVTYVSTRASVYQRLDAPIPTPSAISPVTNVTAPVYVLTDCTVSVGVRSSCQSPISTLSEFNAI